MKIIHWLQIVVFLCPLLVLPGLSGPAEAGWFGNNGPLLEINDISYNEADFRNWWQEWREPEMVVPEDLTVYIEWQLQVQEARKMELDDNPSYQRKVEIFLKSRSLMMLRQEEIDRRMTTPEPGQLRALYDATLQPVIDLEMLQVADRETAARIMKLCQEGQEMKAAAIASGIANPHVMTREKGRPVSVSEFFKPLFADTVKAGQLELLEGENGVWLLVKVVAKTAGSDEDFAEYEEKLRRQFFRDQEPALNTALMQRLRHKYKPLVNQEVLGRLDDLKPGDPGLLETVMTVGEVEVPAWQVARLLKEEKKMYRGKQKASTLSVVKLKKMILTNIETQTMVSLEALDRHFERKPPFNTTYEFYCQRRLIKEFEYVVIGPQVEVTQAEIESEYDKMAARFSRADVVEVAWVQLADERLSNLIAAELKQGRDFSKVMKPYFPQGVEYAKQSEDKLQPELRDIVKTLAPGQVSAPVQKGENTFFVKLIRRFGDQRLTLDQVAGRLRKRLLKEKFAEVREQVLTTLKKGSKTDVNKSRWRKLREALLQEPAAADQTTRAQGENK